MMEAYDRETGEIAELRLPAISPPPAQNLIFASAHCGDVFAALCAMQGAMDAPKRTKKARVQTKTGPGYEYTYAPLDEIIATIKAPMAAAKLAYRQFLASRDGQWVMRTVIGHDSGEWMACDYPIFWDQARGMQGFASGVTYARRYGLMLALGIAAEDDDDANVADGKPAIIEERSAAGARQQAAQAMVQAPVDDSRQRAIAAYNDLIHAIGAAGTNDELDQAGSTARFQEVETLLREAEDEERTKGLMAGLDRRLLLRRDAIAQLRHGSVG